MTNDADAELCVVVAGDVAELFAGVPGATVVRMGLASNEETLPPPLAVPDPESMGRSTKKARAATMMSPTTPAITKVWVLDVGAFPEVF